MFSDFGCALFWCCINQPVTQFARSDGAMPLKYIACSHATSRNTGISRAMIGFLCWAASINGNPKPSPSDGANKHVQAA